MILTISQTVLASALAHAIKPIETRNTIPILSNVLLVASRDTLTCTGASTSAMMRIAVDADVTKPGETTVDAARLHDIVRNFPKGATVKMELGESLKVTCGRSRYTLGVLPAKDYIAFPLENMRPIGETHCAGLWRTVAFAASNDPSRYYMSGVCLNGVDAVATDGHRLGKQIGDLEMPIMTVPVAAVGVIAEMDAPVSLSFNGGILLAEYGRVAYATKLVDGTYPDYKRVIPSQFASHFTIDRDALKSAVVRASSLSEMKSRDVVLTFSNGEDGTLLIESVGTDANAGHEEIDIEGSEGPDVKIKLNSKYVLDALGALANENDEKVTFRMNGGDGPCLITPAGAKDGNKALYLIMPLRLHQG